MVLLHFASVTKIYGVPDPEDAGWGNKVLPSGGAASARALSPMASPPYCTYDMSGNWRWCSLDTRDNDLIERAAVNPQRRPNQSSWANAPHR